MLYKLNAEWTFAESVPANELLMFTSSAGKLTFYERIDKTPQKREILNTMKCWGRLTQEQMNAFQVFF